MLFNNNIGFKKTVGLIALVILMAITCLGGSYLNYLEGQAGLTAWMYEHWFKPTEPLVINSVPGSVEGYICWVFGSDCRMALAVSHAENGTRQCDRISVNKNGSVDFGVFQINTVHIKRIPVRDMVDCQKNIRMAYVLFKEQGWNPWVAYQNKAYLKYLNN